MVTLGGGSGWGVLLDDRQLPTLGTRWGQAVKRACPHPPPKVETAPADEENTPSNRPGRQANNVKKYPQYPCLQYPQPCRLGTSTSPGGRPLPHYSEDEGALMRVRLEWLTASAPWTCSPSPNPQPKANLTHGHVPHHHR